MQQVLYMKPHSKTMALFDCCAFGGRTGRLLKAGMLDRHRVDFGGIALLSDDGE